MKIMYRGQEVTVGSGGSGKPSVLLELTLTASGWSADKTQTVNAPGVVADEKQQSIQPTPSLASQTAYYKAGILCTGEGENSLTFRAETVPTADLTVYAVVTEVQYGNS